MPNYAFAKQVKIVIATMALHNYIRKHRKRDLHFQRVEDNLDDFVYEENQPNGNNLEVNQALPSLEINEVRDQIVISLINTT